MMEPWRIEEILSDWMEVTKIVVRQAFQDTLQTMKNSPEGSEVLRDRPRVISSRVQHLYDLPSSTFGGAYAKFKEFLTR
ncbi:hypothetical protein LIER_18837 [Lithospermum erythrorhizon]|uniref:Uncharacterized protein n=1 Tax=Lithospermum erythrorhizon TaxID=34254 RepID=A0AAV3QH43_LITER